MKAIKASLSIERGLVNHVSSPVSTDTPATIAMAGAEDSVSSTHMFYPLGAYASMAFVE